MFHPKEHSRGLPLFHPGNSRGTLCDQMGGRGTLVSGRKLVGVPLFDPIGW